MRKRIVIIFLIVVVLFILMPIPNYLEDGTKEYKSLIYSVSYNQGMRVKLFGFEIYNNVENEKQSELENNFTIKTIENLMCDNTSVEYYKSSNKTIYTVCLDEIVLKDGNKVTSLKDFFDINKDNIDNAIDKLLTKLNLISNYDKGSIYKNDKIILLKCNSNDIYIVSNYFNVDENNNYCK